MQTVPPKDAATTLRRRRPMTSSTPQEREQETLIDPYLELKGFMIGSMKSAAMTPVVYILGGPMPLALYVLDIILTAYEKNAQITDIKTQDPGLSIRIYQDYYLNASQKHIQTCQKQLRQVSPYLNALSISGLLSKGLTPRTIISATSYLILSQAHRFPGSEDLARQLANLLHHKPNNQNIRAAKELVNKLPQFHFIFNALSQHAGYPAVGEMISALAAATMVKKCIEGKLD